MFGKTMNEEDSSSNIDWGIGKGFSKNTRISRRLDQKKAMVVADSDKNSKKVTKSITKITPNLKKIKSKIRDVYDDDDEDEEDGKTSVIFDFSFDEMGNSLFNALSDEEKTKLNANKRVENLKMQETAGKVAGILQANQRSKELGLKELSKKVVAQKTMDVSFDARTFENSLLENIASQTKLKTENLSSKEAQNLITGLEKMKKSGILNTEGDLNSLSEKMNAKDIADIGKEKSNKKAAKLILEKSGRKDNRNIDKEKDKKLKKERLKQLEKNLDRAKQR